MNHRSEAIAARFTLPTLIAALLVVPVIVGEEFGVGEPWKTVDVVANWAIWLVFAAEVVTMSAVTPGRWAWLRKHPFELAIVVLTPPLLPATLQSARAFRLLRLVRLVVSVKQIRGFFSVEGLRYASLVAVFGILGGGSAFAAIESDQHLNAWDGIYWAIGTVTTAGSDIVPKTIGGRIIAVGMMIIGIGYAAMLTAALAHAFLSRVVRTEAKAVESETIYAEDVVMARLDQIAAQLARLEQAIAPVG